MKNMIKYLHIKDMLGLLFIAVNGNDNTWQTDNKFVAMISSMVLYQHRQGWGYQDDQI
jgi:hypothetical protein